MDKANKLWNKNFFLLWLGQLVSQAGTQGYVIAMMFWIKHATGSGTLMGTVEMVSWTPIVVLGFIAGAFVDRYSRKWIIVLSDILRGIFVITLAAIIYFWSENVGTVIVFMFLISASMATVTSFFNPAINASIPDVVPVEKVEAANSLLHALYNVSLTIGQLFGGVLFLVFGAPLLFLIDGITYIFSGISEMFIKIPQEYPEKRNGLTNIIRAVKTDTLEGLKYVWKNKGMRILIIGNATFDFFFIPIIILFPFYVEDFLGKSVDWYGFIFAAYGAGTLLGLTIVGKVKMTGKVRYRLLILFLILFSIFMGSLGIFKNSLFALLIMFANGVMAGIFNVIVYTILQISSPQNIRGRVFGVFITLSTGLFPISMGLAGVVADLTGKNIPGIFIVCGIIMIIVSLIIFVNKEFYNFLCFERKENE